MKTYNYSLKNRKIEDIINFEEFKNQKNTLIQIFCGQGNITLKNLVDKILNYLPNSICIGTTTDGEIQDKNISTSNTIISISTFENTQIKTSYSEYEESFQNGFSLAKDLVTQNTKLLILFTDGTTTNGENFLKGVQSFNKDVVICGGMAGDNGAFTQTYISCQNKVLKKGAVGVSLNSDILLIHNDYRFNWSPIGIEHKIDKIENNRVYSIHGMTPVDFYAKYLGEDVADALPATGIEFPLIVERDSILTARAVIAKHNDGSLSFAGNLQEGDIVKLGFGNAEMIMQNPIETLPKLSSGKPETFFLYSCMARRRYMPDFIKVEVEPFASIAPTSGFFTYAEFYHNNGANQLLNQTLTVVALSENSSNNKETTTVKNIDNINETSEYARTIQALTHLIQQSSKDYDEQTKKLNIEKSYSNNLLASQKQFLRHAVHETNTPLSVIMGNIELYEMEFGKNKYLSNIEVAMKNVFAIYDDLSFLVKKDQIEYRKQKIELVDYIRSRIDFFTQVALKVNSKILFETTKTEKTIYFNETKLQRIVDNNLTNAIRYTLENEDIFISLFEYDNSYKFLVSSHSSVIQEPEKIFEEYYREQKTHDGFGLGLNLVKKICDEEDVKIELKSNEEFTTFTYTFKRNEQ
ncbi:FIST N-terminal domain-containing protein [Arcobacter sp. LA11]|uniref:FIST N-terminal domain-containing protein n=1 Tax=Arcobacter sp. LA11 TaxID=1898176 RepID=UPI0009325BB0|nr:FIST N-terminal domain-containing protein [Arcobacter sp. LA11]